MTDADATRLSLPPNETRIFSFSFLAQLEDVGKSLEVWRHSCSVHCQWQRTLLQRMSVCLSFGTLILLVESFDLENCLPDTVLPIQITYTNQSPACDSTGSQWMVYCACYCIAQLWWCAIKNLHLLCVFQMTSVCVELGSSPQFCARLHWTGAGGDAMPPLLSQGHSYQRSSRLQHRQQMTTDDKECPVWDDIIVSSVTRYVACWLLILFSV